MGFSHIGICVPQEKFDETVSFYLATLAPLGFKEHMRPLPNTVGLGVWYPDFWITGVPMSASTEGKEVVCAPTHVAFDVNNRSLVHAFHDAAIKAGGKDNGAPGLRPQYARFYYGSFVYDPAGNNIEATCMWPAWTHWKYWFGLGVFNSKQKTS
ncbi:hypothetical protein FQN57_001162 [Myotisia sp. PD_48]|nr:hypothetical protein FQN57_001162 [Myotisia sp. PD_48]